MPLGRGWTDAQLIAAVREASCHADVFAALGIDRSEASEKRVRTRIRLLRIDVRHLRQVTPRTRRTPRWTDDQLREAVPNARSIAGILRSIGLVPAGGNYETVQRRIHELALDVSHFTGRRWNAGVRRVSSRARSLDEILVRGRWVASHGLKKRLLREGLKRAACELCGWAERRACDGQIPVELDHCNGDRTDNRLENLRILCPSCHALQPTHRGLNKRSRRR